MHTQDERWSGVEPEVEVELATDVLPRPGRRDLIEQRGDRGVIDAGPWPEPAGRWRWCQSFGPSPVVVTHCSHNLENSSAITL
jgi:hypothetical protein